MIPPFLPKNQDGDKEKVELEALNRSPQTPEWHHSKDNPPPPSYSQCAWSNADV